MSFVINKYNVNYMHVVCHFIHPAEYRKRNRANKMQGVFKEMTYIYIIHPVYIYLFIQILIIILFSL